ncbi:hypothetical protein [Inmirania thermothiophila]|nr:hypothetical protein [Inmirania thermothiophila]
MGAPAARHRADELSVDRLARESRRYAGSCGTSERAAGAGLRPAFRDRDTGEVFLARFADGRPAPLHILDGLPARYVTRRDARGCVLAVTAAIEAGFVDALGFFLTRAEAAARYR